MSFAFTAVAIAHVIEKKCKFTKTKNPVNQLDIFRRDLFSEFYFKHSDSLRPRLLFYTEKLDSRSYSPNSLNAFHSMHNP